MTRQCLRAICVLMLLCSILYACKKSDSTPDDPIPTEHSASADTISNHLHFLNATQEQGDPPNGPSGNSLKISFKDTLYLSDTLPKPVKFLHTDASENVAGVYLQVLIGSTGGIFSAGHYYDVPEQEEMADSDSVSVVMIGIDEKDLQLPLHCMLRIVPHKENGEPIAEAIKNVVIAEKQDGSSGNGGGCSLVLPPDESWYWMATISYLGGSVFDYYPETIFGNGGQDIEGCCINGVSAYGASCLNADPAFRRTLHFPTSYQISLESFKFLSDGTFVRTTFENTTNPAPGESNFCGDGPGVVKDFIGEKTYSGDWEISEDAPFMNDTRRLFLSTTASSGNGAGFGHRGGYIRQLLCTVGDTPGALTLIDPDPEGNSGRFTVKLYVPFKDDELLAKWFAFN